MRGSIPTVTILSWAIPTTSPALHAWGWGMAVFFHSQGRESKKSLHAQCLSNTMATQHLLDINRFFCRKAATVCFALAGTKQCMVMYITLSSILRSLNS